MAPFRFLDWRAHRAVVPPWGSSPCHAKGEGAAGCSQTSEPSGSWARVCPRSPEMPWRATGDLAFLQAAWHAVL